VCAVYYFTIISNETFELLLNPPKPLHEMLYLLVLSLVDDFELPASIHDPHDQEGSEGQQVVNASPNGYSGVRA
jgi:hypothetical protein